MHPFVQLELSQYELEADKEEDRQYLNSIGSADESAYDVVDLSSTGSSGSDVVDKRKTPSHDFDLNESTTHGTHHDASIYHICYEIRKEAAVVFLVFVSTFAIFPTEIYFMSYEGGFGGEW